MMSNSLILYSSGGVELLDEIRPLWEQLNRHHAALSPHFAADFQAKTFAERKQTLIEKYSGGEMRVEVAGFQDRRVGYLIGAISSKGKGEIESIYIDEDFRGQAIGDQLMRRALDWFDAHQAQTRVIAVAVGNERAYKFYERFGFYPRVVTLKQKIKS